MVHPVEALQVIHMNILQEYKEFGIYFENVDHVDIKNIESDTDLRSFTSGMLSYYPWWLRFLFKIREVLVTVLGLVRHEKPKTVPSITPGNLSFTPGEKARFFTVREAKEDSYWISETPEDKHLTAFFGVVAEKIHQGYSRYHVLTSVRYLHWTGPLYFNLIRPFHHLVVWNMMKAGAKKRRIT